MKKTLIALSVSLFVFSNYSHADNSQELINNRFLSLEQGLKIAEQRAANAENEVKALKKQLNTHPNAYSVPENTVVEQKTTSTNVVVPALTLSESDTLKFYGDVEFNMDGESKKGALSQGYDTSHENWDINGRILLGLDGLRSLDNGNFSGFSVQPLADMTGKMNLDDAVLFFGKKDDWKAKVGRFEAYDMFPLNQDTFVKYSGNTANDLYDDGFGYIYMMKEGRGRSNSGGNFLLNKQIDSWYFEVNTLVENGTSLFVDENYHGREIKSRKNVVYVRPVISWSADEFSIAAAMESNVVSNAYGYKDTDGKWIDQSRRNGFGTTLTWNGLKSNPDNGIVLNINSAYLSASGEKDLSVGTNALWKKFELGYIYAHNKISDFDASTGSVCSDDCWITEKGTYDIHTIHTSYHIPDVMDMKNFNIYLGAYWSWLSAKGNNENTDDRYGGRVRFKYFF